MNPDDLIEAYVIDVAAHLPHRQRNPVTLELRGLIKEELQAKAEVAGSKIDEAMTTEFLQAYGRPMEVAARYRPTLTIIDPADGHRFLRACVIGLAIIWGVGLLGLFQQPMDSVSDLLMALGRWWGAAVIPSLSWPGLLVVGFGLASWARRRWPQRYEWKPPTVDRMSGSRAAAVIGLAGILFGLSVLVDPAWFVLGSGAARAAHEAFTYTDTFRQRQAPWLFALILLNIPLLIAMIVKARPSPGLQRIEVVMALAMCAVLAWTTLGGPVFVGASGDRVLKSLLPLIIVLTLVHVVIQLRRSLTPAVRSSKPAP